MSRKYLQQKEKTLHRFLSVKSCESNLNTCLLENITIMRDEILISVGS